MDEIEETIEMDASIMRKTSKALERSLCDHCLGRLYARSGFGLTNDQRGKALRTVLALWMEEPGADRTDLMKHIVMRIPVHPLDGPDEEQEEEKTEEDGDWNVVKGPSFPNPWTEEGEEEDRCWLCHDIFNRLDDLTSRVEIESMKYQFSSFLIGCRVDPATSHREQILWETVNPASAEPLKEEINRELGKLLDGRWGDKEVDKGNPDVTFVVDPLFNEIKVQIKPLFIYGRYKKLKRGIPQTRWTCRTCRGKGCEACGNTGKRYDTSVEQEIGPPFMKAAEGEEYRLHGMGREDIDVTTLGRGRPFILEVRRPRKREIDLGSIMMEVNGLQGGYVEIDELRYAERKEVPLLKSYRSRKRYRASVSFKGEWNEENLKYGITLLARSPIKQRTPDRVSHRRSDLVRERSVHEVEYVIMTENSAEIDLLTDAGLYIKELMHGDGGRTDPSLASLMGCEVTVDSLTVLDILYDEDDEKRSERTGGEAHGEEIKGNNGQHKE